MTKFYIVSVFSYDEDCGDLEDANVHPTAFRSWAEADDYGKNFCSNTRSAYEVTEVTF